MQYYGIDLGTSSCLVARVNKNIYGDFEVKCLTDADGDFVVPSVVSFESSTQCIFGSQALKRLYTHPELTIELIKLRLGKTKKIEIHIDNQSIIRSPQEITAYLLNYINSIHDMKIIDAVVTVPAFFDQSQKDATMQAGTIANVSPKILIEEPTAALICHIFEENKRNGRDFFRGENLRRVLVFDFGGGTLDLSLVHIEKLENGIFPRVIGIGGDPELGGITIDLIFCKVIVEYLTKKYQDNDFLLRVGNAFSYFYSNFNNGKSNRFPENTPKEIVEYIYRLKKDLEEVKIKLSSKESVRLTFSGNIDPIDITRDMFERKVIQNEELNIREKIEDAIQEISSKKESLHEVLLVGGSSQIPFIRKIIFEALADFGVDEKSIIISSDYETAVAKGAAIQSALLSGVEIPPFLKNRCESVVARDIEICHGNKSIILVLKGTKYPFTSTKEFILEIGHSLSESIDLVLNEIIEKGNVKLKNFISRFQFYLPVYYTDEKIIIRMNIDEAGLYQIEAIHDISKESVEYEPTKPYSLNDDEIAKAKKNTISLQGKKEKV